MKREEILARILQAAKRDEEKRQDARYLGVMGFLVAKGFLKTNRAIPLLPNKKVHIADAVWAGQNVEPRILEVLPAAALRLPRHFDLNYKDCPELFTAVKTLRKQEETGASLWGIPFDKYKVWATLTLPDRRIKSANEKRVTKTFRLKPETVARLKAFAKKTGCSETEALENSIFQAE